MIRRLTAVLAFVAIANPLCCCRSLAEAGMDGKAPVAEHSCCESTTQPATPTDHRETPDTPEDCACCTAETIAVAAEFPLTLGAVEWQWRSDLDFGDRITDLLTPPAAQFSHSDFALPDAARPSAPRFTQLLCVYLI